MSRTKHPTLPYGEMPRPGESFFNRFHRRKSEARLAENTPGEAAQETAPDGAASAAIRSSSAEAVTEEEPTDADMPPIESLGAESDYTGFLSPKVSETLRRAALRKLFHGSTFNVTDELDDYAEDFTTFEALGDIITADMRHQIELEAESRAEAARQALLEDDEPVTRPNDELDPDAVQTIDPGESGLDAEQTAAGAPAEPSIAEAETSNARN